MKRKILGMMGKMEVLVREEGRVGIIEMAGEIDIYNCGELRKIIDEYINRKITRIVVDLGKVTYIDSSTIGVLLSEQKRLDAQRGGLKLLNLKGAPRNVLEMARLQDIFSIYDDERKAIESFGGTD
ncbi:MAG: STAS domain-containing protein [Candidatus Aureabacteria bacterium]|jgi:anti-anti-sigma factor|nr:STAS domain-containing protein [Candidatus Auribacterota bacterium]